MIQYKKIVSDVIENGSRKNNRTGVDTIAIAGAMFGHDMAEGFPILTTKFVPLQLVATELEGFIKGVTDKRWFQDRGCRIWDEWCNPQKVPYGKDDETRARMAAENDLGPIYGSQWRNFDGKGVDQLMNLVDTLKSDPDCRRMIVSAWNPADLNKMALPPCHYCFQVTVIDGMLNLLWNQRSVDVALGLPFNIASYGLLLHLLCVETRLKPGKLIGFLGDVHAYVPHVPGLLRQVQRKPFRLPTVRTVDFTSIFDWKATDTIFETEYERHSRINYEVAI